MKNPSTPLLAPQAAKDFGRVLRFLRTSREQTLRDVSRPGLGTAYLEAIEHGRKVNLTPTTFAMLAQTYQAPPDLIANEWFKARIMSALEERGLDPEQRSIVWRAVESRMDEMGYHLRDEVARFVQEILS